MAERGEIHHEAFFYADPDEYLAGTVPFVREGIEAGEAVLVALPREKRELVRDALGADAELANFAAMEEMGRNPGRLLSAWTDFALANPSAGTRGLGEPAWAGRSAAALEECGRHEALLNLPIADSQPVALLCPYDAAGLDDEVLIGAERCHLAVSGRERSASYDAGEDVFAGRLERPAGEFVETVFGFDAATLHSVRRLVFAEAARAGLETARAGDLVLAASEIATNSIRHGGGTGVLQIWRREDEVICDFRDSGRIVDPLAGRLRPGFEQVEGRGLWVANQLCDLVQIRWDDGNVVRLWMGSD
ncbi:MAG TPA: sensor histidine kinase [Solirubrobacterales bacterium]|jgi:anti-sigma regulatory factor (Ser/Thr protein kinase)